MGIKIKPPGFPLIPILEFKSLFTLDAVQAYFVSIDPPLRVLVFINP
jgi:hypothetical protein